MIFYVNKIKKKNDIIVKNAYFLYSYRLFLKKYQKHLCYRPWTYRGITGNGP